ILQEKPVVSDKSVAVAKHESETESEEEDSAKTGIDDALHQHVDGLSRATESRFQHGEADLHTKDQERRDERPNCVQRIDNVVALYFRIGGKNFAETHQVWEQGHDPEQQQTNAYHLPCQQQRSIP